MAGGQLFRRTPFLFKKQRKGQIFELSPIFVPFYYGYYLLGAYNGLVQVPNLSGGL